MRFNIQLLEGIRQLISDSETFNFLNQDEDVYSTDDLKENYNTTTLPTMQKIKAVIFDLDGTLANTLPLCITAFRNSIEPLVNRSVTDEEIIATFGPSEEGTIMALAPAFYEKGVADYIDHYENLHGMCPTSFTEIPQLLATLKDRGIRTAMVTGKGKRSADISLEKFGIAGYFELLEAGMPEGPRKPKGIQNILNVWDDLTKSEVIYVGDAPSDVTACREVGIPIIAAAWAETAEPDKLEALSPDELFYTVADFENWLYSKI